MANNAFPFTPQLNVFQAADDAWGDELRRIFGQRAAEARYTSLGEGEEGSSLRRLFEARQAARSAWHRSAS